MFRFLFHWQFGALWLWIPLTPHCSILAIFLLFPLPITFLKIRKGYPLGVELKILTCMLKEKANRVPGGRGLSIFTDNLLELNVFIQSGLAYPTEVDSGGPSIFRRNDFISTARYL